MPTSIQSYLALSTLLFLLLLTPLSCGLLPRSHRIALVRSKSLPLLLLLLSNLVLLSLQRPGQITPKHLPEYGPVMHYSAAKKVSSRTTTPDTKWAPRKCSFLWLSYNLGKAVGLMRTKWRPFLWALLIGIVAGVTPTVEARRLGIDLLLPTVAILSLLTGLVTGKLTRQRRMACISGVTPVIMLTVYVSIYQYPFLTGTWTVFLILALICGLISFGGASFATRKHRK